jgi:glycosyltransferase involved in cell wall biosynthesis
MKTAIVVPVYNEEERISGVLKRIKKSSADANVIVVDDGSSDNSRKIVTNNFKDVLLLEHNINLGKGAALKTGCEAAIKLGADIIVLIDADGQHSPEVIPEMAKRLEKENLDIVFGSRKIDIKKMPAMLYFGNIVLTAIINYFSKVYVKDTQSGLKAFKASVYKKLLWSASDYSVETEMIVNTGKNNLKYGEVFIDTIYNGKYRATPFDGFKILFNLLKQKIYDFFN